MKFCKVLHKVAEASDPSFMPYWPHYKKLKKLIKSLSVASEGCVDDSNPAFHGNDSVAFGMNKQGSDNHFHAPQQRQDVQVNSFDCDSNSIQGHYRSTQQQRKLLQQTKNRMAKTRPAKHELKTDPREVAFFEFLRLELGKATDFFGKAEQQFLLREEIVRLGMDVLHRPHSSIIPNRWAVFSRAAFILHKDLLLLETFAIVSYFAFSKILKKYDKVTGHQTRGPFMVNVVNKANFTNYPKILEMIERCQKLYDDASQQILQDIYEDERLFLYMVQHFQQQSEEGHPTHSDDQGAQDKKRPAQESKLEQDTSDSSEIPESAMTYKTSSKHPLSVGQEHPALLPSDGVEFVLHQLPSTINAYSDPSISSSSNNCAEGSRPFKKRNLGFLGNSSTAEPESKRFGNSRQAQKED